MVAVDIGLAATQRHNSYGSIQISIVMLSLIVLDVLQHVSVWNISMW